MDFLRVEDNYFPWNYSLNARGKLFTIHRPVIMGILNTTPDSFYKHSRYSLTDNYIAAAAAMISDGAGILDIGGYSSRPGAADIGMHEERARVVPVIAAIRREFPDILISIDTFRGEVARAACEHGADIVNDISGGELDEQMFRTVAALHCPYILMHMRGTPKTMQEHTAYSCLTAEIAAYFSQKLEILRSLGVHDVLLDPGFGFAKTIEQNFALLEKSDLFHFFEKPLLVGISRKSMLTKSLNITAEAALNATTAMNMAALRKGAAILRVHDVKAAAETVQLYEQLQRASQMIP